MARGGGETAVASEKGSVEHLSECDVNGVVRGHIVSHFPDAGQQTLMSVTAKRQRGDVVNSLASAFRVDRAFRNLATQNLSGLDIDQVRGVQRFARGRTCDARSPRQSVCGGALLSARTRRVRSSTVAFGAKPPRRRRPSMRPARVSRVARAIPLVSAAPRCAEVRPADIRTTTYPLTLRAPSSSDAGRPARCEFESCSTCEQDTRMRCACKARQPHCGSETIPSLGVARSRSDFRL